MNSPDLQYPIGKFQKEAEISDTRRRELIEGIATLPAQLQTAARGLSEQQLNTPYRPGGWTVRQVIHHLPDSHMNAYVRFRLALTEQEPTIKPYDEKKWAELTDARTAPIDLSLTLLNSLHERWTLLLRALSAKDFTRTFRHPELGVLTLDVQLSLYHWHGRHHLAHITSLRQRMGWA
jgi:hypothetical protein